MLFHSIFHLAKHQEMFLVNFFQYHDHHLVVEKMSTEK